MPDHNPFDMDGDGDVDGIDFLGFQYLTRHVLQPDEEADEPENEYEESEIDEDDDDSWEDEPYDDF